MLVHLVNQQIGEGKITDGVVILVSVEIVAISHKGLSESVRIIEHGSHSVKTESVEVEFCEPVLTVAQQEVYYLVLSIVEAQAVPCRMLMPVARIEVLVGVASQIAQSLNLILYCMRVHNIHDNSNSVLMGSIDE